MVPTSSLALAADVSANATGDQFGSGSGPSAQAEFDPGTSSVDGRRYSEFLCTDRGRETILWYDEIGGVWVAMNGGFETNGEPPRQSTAISIPAARRSSAASIDTALQTDLSSAFASSGTSVRTVCSLTSDIPDEFYCLLRNPKTHLSVLALYQVGTASGKVVSLNAHKTSAGAQTAGTSTAPPSSGSVADSYQACSNTVASTKSMTVDLRTYLRNHANATTMHDDFEALGLDLGLLARQVETGGQDSNGVIFQNAGAAYLADAEEVVISGQLLSPPGDFGAALRASCPHSFAAAGLPGGGESSGAESNGSRSANGGGDQASQTSNCGGPIAAPDQATFEVDYHLGSCQQALKITHAYIDASSEALDAGKLPGNETVAGWKCSVSLNNPKLVQYFCIGSSSGEEVEGVIKQPEQAAAPSGASVVSVLNDAFTANPPKLCAHGLLCTKDPMCNVASATVGMSQVDVGMSCSALARSLSDASTYGSWTAQSATIRGGGTGCNLMGTGSLDNTDLIDVAAVSGASAADLCQALEASGDWTGQAG